MVLMDILKRSVRNNLLVLLVVFITIILIMLSHYEQGEETWGYWFFSRLLSEGDGFINLQRSPLYTAYLQLFYWIGYPYSFAVEWFVTSSIVVYAVYRFLSIHMNKGYALFSIILWLPFIRFSDPPVQSLALATTCFAFMLRHKAKTSDSKRLIYSIFYSLLIIAYMLRQTYIVAISFVILWDLWSTYKNNGFRGVSYAIRPRVNDWPLFVVLSLIMLFFVFQSGHQWNNGWFSTIDWFPVSASLSDGGFINSMNWHYIQNNYTIPSYQDFYFTNQEIFKGAKTTLEAILFNPYFVADVWLNNTIDTIDTVAVMSVFGGILKLILPHIGTTVGVLFLLYGAYKATSDNNEFLFLLVTILLISVHILYVPKERYLVPIVPFMILSMYWYGTYFQSRVVALMFQTKASITISFFIILGILSIIVVSQYWVGRLYSRHIFMITPIYTILIFGLLSQVFSYSVARSARQLLLKISKSKVIISLLLISFTPVYALWTGIINDFSKGNYRILQSDEHSIKSSYKEIQSLSKNCTGIMSLDIKLFAVFIDKPIESFYDVWEIPPFGSLENSTYRGLRPDRIDCIFVSDILSNKNTPGIATNSYIRYDKYIRPYVTVLEDMGAKIYNISGYGKAVILK